MPRHLTPKALQVAYRSSGRRKRIELHTGRSLSWEPSFVTALMLSERLTPLLSRKKTLHCKLRCILVKATLEEL